MPELKDRAVIQEFPHCGACMNVFRVTMIDENGEWFIAHFCLCDKDCSPTYYHEETDLLEDELTFKTLDYIPSRELKRFLQIRYPQTVKDSPRYVNDFSLCKFFRGLGYFKGLDYV